VRAFDMVKMEAQAQGVSPTWSEIVGLVPERALFDTAARHLQLRGFTPDQVLERKVRAAISGGETVSGFVASVAAATPAPGGGSVVAHVGALGAALAQMVAGLTVGRKKYAAVEGEMKSLALEASALGNALAALVERDAKAYEQVMKAYTLPKETDEQVAARTRAIDDALMGAAAVPLETARACAAVAELAERAAAKGNPNCVSDAGVAALFAEAACRGAVYNVRINVSSLSDRARGASLLEEAAALLVQARAHVDSATRLVDAAIGN